MNLFPHNQKAVDAVMANFKTSDRAAVVHCCGSGKSHIGGAVTENFKNVLIVAPNDHVLGQASKTAPKAECRTYAWISMQDFGNFRRLHREEYDTILKTYLS